MHSKAHPTAFKKLAAIILADVLFFSMIDPRRGNMLILIVACLLAYISVYAICRLGMWLFVKIFPISVVAQKRAALTVTIGITFLLFMQSLGQLSSRDIFAVAPLMLVAYFYMAYASSTRNKNFDTRV